MARRQYTKKDDIAPRDVDVNKKPNIKLYPDYDEEIVKEGELWYLKGWFYDAEYMIPIRTKYSFNAMAQRYRLQLKGEIDKVDPNTGQVFPGDNRAAQFTEGRYETRDLFEVRCLYRSDAFTQGRIWDTITEGAKQREGAYKATKNMILKDAEFKERFMAEMLEDEDLVALMREKLVSAPKKTKGADKE